LLPVQKVSACKLSFIAPSAVWLVVAKRLGIFPVRHSQIISSGTNHCGYSSLYPVLWFAACPEKGAFVAEVLNLWWRHNQIQALKLPVTLVQFVLGHWCQL